MKNDANTFLGFKEINYILPKKTAMFLDKKFFQGIWTEYSRIGMLGSSKQRAEIMFDLENRKRMSQISAEDLCLLLSLVFILCPRGEVCVLCRLYYL
jgi:hypothetical protein